MGTSEAIRPAGDQACSGSQTITEKVIHQFKKSEGGSVCVQRRGKKDRNLALARKNAMDEQF
jgi:hypothetical protein